MAFVIPVDAIAPGGEGGTGMVGATKGFNAAGSAATTGGGVLVPPVVVGVVARLGLGCIVCAVWVVIP